MANPLRFYYDRLSQPCRALYIFLEQTKIPHEKVLIDVRKGQHLTDHFKAINRFQKVPCIVEKDFHLAESVAIVRYLARKYKPAAAADHCWYPEDSYKRARIDEYLEWHHLNVRKDCAIYFHYLFYRPLMFGTKVNRDQAEKFKTKMEACLDFVEKVYLGEGNPFLAGDDFSVADLFAACELEQTKVTGYDPGTGRPKLAAWMARVQDAANPYYDEVHEDVRCWKRDLSEKERHSVEACYSR